MCISFLFLISPTSEWIFLFARSVLFDPIFYVFSHSRVSFYIYFNSSHTYNSYNKNSMKRKFVCECYVFLFVIRWYWASKCTKHSKTNMYMYVISTNNRRLMGKINSNIAKVILDVCMGNGKRWKLIIYYYWCICEICIRRTDLFHCCNMLI